MRKYYYFLVALPLIIMSCKGGKESQENADYMLKGDTVCLKTGSALAKKLQSSIAALSPYNEVFTVSGVVQAIPNDFAQIASPFAGRVIKSFVCLGQRVRAGSPLFEISSADFYDAVKDYCQSLQEMRAAYITMKREKDLLRNNVGVKKEEEDAALNYALKKKDVENARAALSVYHLSPAELRLGHPLIVRSPIAGEVVKNNIVTGAYLKEDAEPIAAVANLDKVWMVAHVKEKDINLIHRLSNVVISLVSMPDRPITGRVFHIGEMMDENTHSVEVIIECDNTRRYLKPGMYGYVKLTDKAVLRIIVPSSALLQEENDNYVFVKVAPQRYMRRSVQTMTTSDHRIVILSGLKPGEEIITTGAFYLNNII